MKWLASSLMIFALASAAAGVSLITNKSLAAQNPGWADVGKAMLTLAISSFVGGFVAVAIKMIERDRQEREIWGNLLRDVVGADQTLAIARQLIKAHKTAKTYAEQHANLIETRLVLRRVWIDPLVADDRKRRGEVIDMRSYLDQMKVFVDGLCKEYEDNYLSVARQQRIDEVYLKTREVEVAKTYPQSAWPDDPMYQPTQAWILLIANSGPFPKLRELIGEGYSDSCFRQAFVQLRPMLEKRAGIRRSSGVLEPTAP